MKQVFGPHAQRLQISSTKSQLGHTLGASGGIELIVSALAIHTGVLPPTINLDHPGEGCDLDYIPNVARETRVNHVMSNSFGFGGHNASLLIGRYRPLVIAAVLSPIPVRLCRDYACVARDRRYNQIEQARGESGQPWLGQGKAKRMNPPHPTGEISFSKKESLREAIPDAGRIVLWLPGDRDASFQYWERIANVARGEIAAVGGPVHDRSHFDSGPATDRRTHGPALESPGRVAATARFPASQWGRRGTMRRQTERPDPGLVRRRETITSTTLESRHGGPRLAGSRSWGKTSSSSADSSHTRAAVRPNRTQCRRRQPNRPARMPKRSWRRRGRTGLRDKEATALTDLGAIQLNEGDPQGAIASLEQALAITRQIGDTARESDVLGNLGMAMLTVRQPERARELFTQELAHARATTDRFAEKVALERLGIAVVEPARLQRLSQAL